MEDKVKESICKCLQNDNIYPIEVFLEYGIISMSDFFNIFSSEPCSNELFIKVLNLVIDNISKSEAKILLNKSNRIKANEIYAQHYKELQKLLFRFIDISQTNIYDIHIKNAFFLDENDFMVILSKINHDNIPHIINKYYGNSYIPDLHIKIDIMLVAYIKNYHLTTNRNVLSLLVLYGSAFYYRDLQDSSNKSIQL